MHYYPADYLARARFESRRETEERKYLNGTKSNTTYTHTDTYTRSVRRAARKSTSFCESLQVKFSEKRVHACTHAQGRKQSITIRREGKKARARNRVRREKKKKPKAGYPGEKNRHERTYVCTYVRTHARTHALMSVEAQHEEGTSSRYGGPRSTDSFYCGPRVSIRERGRRNVTAELTERGLLAD